MTPRIKVATMWLGGCSGCHMSFLDMDEWLIDLFEKIEVVFSPIVDNKIYPDDVDVLLLEGSVTNEDNLEFVLHARPRTKIIVSFGDCAVTGNVTAMRNPLGNPTKLVEWAYKQGKDGVVPNDKIGAPTLLQKAVPVHAVVPVEYYLPGCPPPAPRIRALLEQMLAGGPVKLEGADMLRFG